MSERTTIMKKVLALSVFVLMVFAWISEPAIAQPYPDPWGYCLPEPNPTGAGCWVVCRAGGGGRPLQQPPPAATSGPPAVQQAGRVMLGLPDAARDQSRLSRWHMRSSVLADKSGSGPLAQSGTDGNGEEISR